jgi:hypothetical protein
MTFTMSVSHTTQMVDIKIPIACAYMIVTIIIHKKLEICTSNDQNDN